MLDLLNNRQREIRIVMQVCAVLVTIIFLFGLPDSLVQSSIRLATPFVLGSLGALLASRAGVLNLAIEGKMLLGAFVGVAVLFQSGLDPLVGVIAATVSGWILGLVFAVLYLRIRINLIILALAVNLLVANGTVYLRGQVGTDLEGNLVGLGDPAAQAEQAMANVELLLREAGSDLSHIVKTTIYITDPRHREPVYVTVGRWLRGVHPVSTGLVVSALAQPEWLMEIDVIAVVPQ